MALNINSRLDQNFCVMTITGHLTLGPDLQTFQEAAKKALKTDVLNGMILDVNGIRYTDSAGLGALTIVFSHCSRKNCPLVIATVPNQLQQMLELTRLDALLPSAPDVEAAKRLARKLRGPDKDK